MAGGAGATSGSMGGRPPATLVVLAAGSGKRLGAGRPKAMVEVGGRPMYEWSLRAARRAARVDAVVIAAPPGHKGELDAAAGEFDVEERRAGAKPLPVSVVAGGAARSESVLRALEGVETELVAIHDAARPLVEPELIDLVLGRLGEERELAGVVAAAPVIDTIKVAAPPGEGGGAGDLPVVEQTLDRSRLWAVQTPQAFRLDALREALARAGGDLARATDDAMLVEEAGGRVAVLPWSRDNFKVTTPADLGRADAVLSHRIAADA